MAKGLFVLLLLVAALIFLLLRLAKRLATGHYTTPQDIDEARREVSSADNPLKFTLNMVGHFAQIAFLLVLIILIAIHYFH